MAADLNALLLKTSRTFALAIPLLPEPTRREVGVAYLLFRIADTFEDATRWPRSERITALNEFAALLQDFSPARAKELTAKWVAKPPCEHEGYLELLGETPAVLAELETMPPGVRKILLEHTRRTSLGMAEVVSRADEKGNLRLDSVDDLKRYCYIVAGIVGELLTEVFLHDAPQLAEVATVLRRDMVRFGEALQLVNILKDVGDDEKDGRVYLPTAVPRAQIFELARANLEVAGKYVEALQQAKAPRGFLAFTGMPVLLARAALRATESSGAGAKVSRLQVAALMAKLMAALDGGAALGPLLASA